MKTVLLRAVCLLACAVLVARCDSLTEPVAVTPDALRPVLVGDLDRTVGEDEAVCVSVQAEDPNGDGADLEIVLVQPAPQGRVERVASCAAQVAAHAPARAAPAAGAPPQAQPEERAAPVLPSGRKLDPTDALKGRERVREAPPLEEEAAEEPVPDAQAGADKGGGGLEVPAAGVVGGIRYTPAQDFFGTESFSLKVRNRVSRFESHEATVTITVTPVPDPPAAVPGVLRDTTLTVGSTLTKDLNAAFVDPDCPAGVPCAPLRYAVRSAPAEGVVEVGLNENVLEVTALSAPGQQAQITVTASDGDHEATTPFTVTVQRGTNQPPQKVAEIMDRQLAVGEAYEVDLNAIFVDPDGDALRFTEPPPESSDPGVAEAVLLADGVTLRVTMRAVGFSTITVTASDGRGGEATESFSVSLEEGVNAVDDEAATLEDESVTINVLRNDFDTNSRPLSIFSFVQPRHGTAVQAGDSSITYVPAPGFFGADSFDYVAENDVGDVDRATVSVSVLPKNRPPQITAVTGPFSGTAGQAFTFTAEASDPDGDVLFFTWTFGDGSAAEFGENLTRVSHVYSTPGSYTLTLRVEDDDGAADTARRTVTVVEGNTPPAITSTPETSARAGLPYRYDVVASDADGDALTIAATTRPAWLAFTDHGDGTATLGGTPASGDIGTHPVTLEVRDGRGGIDVQSFTLTVSSSNLPPRVVTPIRDLQITVGTSRAFNLNNVFDDPNPGDVLRFEVTANSNPDALDAALADDSTLTLQALLVGEATVVVEAEDPEGLTAADTFAVTTSLNNPPTVNDPGPQQHVETIGVLLRIQASDPDGDSFGFSSIDLPPNLSINSASGLISGNLATDAADNSPYATQILVTDNRGGQTILVIPWTVINPAPSVQPLGDRADDEAAAITPIQLMATDDDSLAYDDGGTLPPGLLVDADGRIQGTVDTDAAGATGIMVYPVTLTVTDGQGAQGTAAFDWTVANPVPVAQDLGDQADDEAVAITPIQLMATDDDSLAYDDGGTLPPGLSIDATGLVSGVVDPDAAGVTGSATYAVVLTASDAQGGSDSTAFAWTVTNPTPTATAPSAQSDTAGVAVTPLQIEATDDDAPLNYAATGLPPGLSIDATGLIGGAIDLTAGAVDPYAVEVVVSDDQAGADSVQFDWFVVNPAPTLSGLSPDAGSRGATLPVTLSGDRFIDGVSTVDFGPDILVNATVDDATQITATITIDPLATPGEREVTVTNAGPGGGVSATRVFTVNAPATARGDTTYTATTGVLLSVPDGPTDLLANDDLGFPEATLTSFGGGDLGGTVADHAAGTTVPVGVTGSLTVKADGSFDFTSDAGFTGAFLFRYRITNAVGTSDATVRITVTL